MIQIHREDGTTMLQLDFGAQIYAAMARALQGEQFIIVGAATSPEEFAAECVTLGPYPIRESITNVVESLEAALKEPNIVLGLTANNGSNTMH